MKSNCCNSEIHEPGVCEECCRVILNKDEVYCFTCKGYCVNEDKDCEFCNSTGKIFVDPNQTALKFY